VIRRFQIEDILSQDEHGVVFEAEDRETGKRVAVRRIFPFGANGGGLKGEQVAAYEIGIQRFSAVQHPGLRTVVAGGCDPVDGMPFLATEWVEGPTLAKALAAGPIASASVVALMDRVLEVCEVLSEALAEESVWVETSPAAIIVSAEDLDRGFTFWVAPLSWLDETEGGRSGLSPLVSLFREATARLSPTDSPQVITELKRWGSWLEVNAPTATLAQARKNLRDWLVAPAPAPAPQPAVVPAAPVAQPVAVAQPTQYAGVIKPPGVGPATATQTMAAPAPQMATAVAPPKRKSVLMPLFTVTVVSVCLAGAGFQFWRYRQSKKTAITAATADPATAGLDAAIRRAVAGPGPGGPAAPAAPMTVIPPGHPSLGTWKYAFEKSKYTRTFTTENGVSYCQLAINGKPAWKVKVTQVTADDVVIKDPTGPNLLHHVVSKDGKKMKIEGKFDATR